VHAWTAGLLACIAKYAFWWTQNSRGTLRHQKCGAPSGRRAQQIDAHHAVRQSPEQARRPAVRAQAVNRTNPFEGKRHMSPFGLVGKDQG